MVRKGFTLIELSLVIITIGIIGALALGQFADLSGKANANNEDTTAENVVSGIAIYKTESYATGRSPIFPASLDSASAGQASPLNSFFSEVLHPSITRGDQWSKLLSGKYVGPAENIFEYNPTNGIFEKLGQLIIEDDFNDEDASGWDVANGSWSVTGGEYHDTSGGMAATFNGLSSWSDYSLFSQLQLTNGNRAGMYFRMTDTDPINANKRGYMFIYARDYGPGGGFFIRRLQAGANPIIVNASAPVGFDWNAAHDIRIDANSSNLRVVVDGTEYLNVNDATYSNGQIGLKVNNGSNANFDNVEVIK